MARRGRGGRRSGQPGKAYGNRSDLQQGVRVTSGNRQYGEVKEAEARQQAIPLPRQAPPVTNGGAGGGGAAPPRPPDAPPPLTAPTQIPGQPVTAGLPIGPGGGPALLAANPTGDLPEVEQLLALYRAHPTQALARLIERLAPPGSV